MIMASSCEWHTGADSVAYLDDQVVSLPSACNTTIFLRSRYFWGALLWPKLQFDYIKAIVLLYLRAYTIWEKNRVIGVVCVFALLVCKPPYLTYRTRVNENILTDRRQGAVHCSLSPDSRAAPFSWYLVSFLICTSITRAKCTQMEEMAHGSCWILLVASMVTIAHW